MWGCRVCLVWECGVCDVCDIGVWECGVCDVCDVGVWVFGVVGCVWCWSMWCVDVGVDLTYNSHISKLTTCCV